MPISFARRFLLLCYIFICLLGAAALLLTFSNASIIHTAMSGADSHQTVSAIFDQKDDIIQSQWIALDQLACDCPANTADNNARNPERRRCTDYAQTQTRDLR